MQKITTSIQLTKETWVLLSKIGRKEQTYDQIIRELILSKNKAGSLEDKTGNQNHSSESSYL
jgi:hypothetical protein